ncbi:MAG: hypothetical protein JW896_11850 [Deltaproteobacteria bacterium]|nr:hypothetical protein [Deltaproteobacteria bacterium]
MPIEYELSENGRRIDASPKGVLDADQTMDYFKRLEIDSSIKPNAIEIVDFSEVTDFKMSYLESQDITRSYQKLKTVQSIQATVFLCKSPVSFGISRMFQALHEIANPKHKVFVVKTDAELEEQLIKLQQDIQD